MNKNLLHAVRLFVLFILTSYFSNAQSVNLIANPGFEQGTGNDFTEWVKFNGASNLLATTTTSEVYSGARALKATSPGGEPYQTQLASNEATTIVGNTYTYSFYIKAATAGTTVRLSTSNGDTNYGNDHYSPDFTVTTDWQKVTGTFVGYDVKTRLLLDLGKNVNTYFVDEVSLTTPLAATGDYVFNDAFPLSHQFQGYGTGAIREEVTNTPINPLKPVKIGSKSLYIKTGSDYSAIALMKYNAVPTVITQYTGGFSFWIYGSESSTGQNVSVNVGIVAETPAPSYSWVGFSTTKNFQVPVGKWKKCHVAWSEIGNPTTVSGIIFGADAGNTYLIDDVKYLFSAPCAEPVNTVSGTVKQDATNDGIANPTNYTGTDLFVTVKKGADIEDVIPVVNGAFSLDANLCNEAYEISLSTKAGGTDVAIAPSGNFFGIATASGVTGTNGKIKLTFNQNILVVPTARKAADVTDLTFNLQTFSPQPVTLNKFAAKLGSKGVHLNWSTSSETNFSHFEVQKSITGKEFQALNKVTANTSSMYSAFDLNPTAGINYYRLKMVDLDGTSEYSKIVSIDYNANKAYVDFANPVNGNVITLKSNTENPSFALYNSMGKKITISVMRNGDGNFQIAPSQKLEGVYFLNVNSKTGTISKKVLFK